MENEATAQDSLYPNVTPQMIKLSECTINMTKKAPRVEKNPNYKH